MSGTILASRDLAHVFAFDLSVPVQGRTYNALLECGKPFAQLGAAPVPQSGVASPDQRRWSPYRLILRPSFDQRDGSDGQTEESFLQSEEDLSSGESVCEDHGGGVRHGSGPCSQEIGETLSGLAGWSGAHDLEAGLGSDISHEGEGSGAVAGDVVGQVGLHSTVSREENDSERTVEAPGGVGMVDGGILFHPGGVEGELTEDDETAVQEV